MKEEILSRSISSCGYEIDEIYKEINKEMFTRNIIEFKSKQTTDPSKLASAIAHNIVNADIRVSCLGPQAVNAAIKALVIAKRYTQNENFTLTFDFFSVDEVGVEDGSTLNVIQVIISKIDKEVK